MDFRAYLAEKLKDPEFKKEWDALEPEFEQAHAEIEKRVNAQKNLPKRIARYRLPLKNLQLHTTKN